jgi:hypothetical protein
MTENRTAGLYALALVPTVAAALVVSGWVMDVSKHQAPRQPSGAGEWALNILPAFATGLLIFLVVARFVRIGQIDASSLRAHVRRSAVLYAVTFALGALLLHDGGSPDFWSLGQIVLWIWVTTVAGIVADAIAALRTRGGGTVTVP